MISTADVTVGMPVRNGEKFIGDAIGSVLRQTHASLRLVIADNASTDGTEDICRSHARRDDRVTYHRHPENIGAGPNFDFAYHMADGTPFFRWMAHDDMLAPTCLERSVAALRTVPEATLCQTDVIVLRGGQRTVARRMPDMDVPRPSDRLASVMMAPHWCFDVFAVIRSDALKRTGLLSRYYGADRGLLAELALIGPFTVVDEPLFINRDHRDRSMRALDPRQQQIWNDPKASRQAVAMHWERWRDYRRAVLEHVDDATERKRCMRLVRTWWLRNWNTARVAIDLATARSDRLARAWRALRERSHDDALGASEEDEPNAEAMVSLAERQQ